jgi:DNA primase
MSGRIKDEDVTYLRERVPIDEVVADYVQLKSAGGGQKKGLCPFHDEKSPSFHVTPSKGFYHCFGCQASGDVISFFMKMDHLTFTETLERLADRIGYTLRYEENSSGPSVPIWNAFALDCGKRSSCNVLPRTTQHFTRCRPRS